MNKVNQKQEGHGAPKGHPDLLWAYWLCFQSNEYHIVANVRYCIDSVSSHPYGTCKYQIDPNKLSVIIFRRTSKRTKYIIPVLTFSILQNLQLFLFPQREVLNNGHIVPLFCMSIGPLRLASIYVQVQWSDQWESETGACKGAKTKRGCFIP